MVVTYTYNTQFHDPLVNALKQAVEPRRLHNGKPCWETPCAVAGNRTKTTCNEQEYQQRPNGVDLTLWKSKLTRANWSAHTTYATTDRLTSSSSKPLNQGARTYPQKGAAKSKQPTNVTGTN